ncbi:ATP-binding cassette domain-containing protein [Rummeliibacillus sp. SL167]
MNLTINKSNVIALIGPSSAGKSTLMEASLYQKF